ncbi:hypothetical protein BVX98_01040 [bacterium F11]|nr:hypothetical protein BVX98_01040 [bacterium F11]
MKKIKALLIALAPLVLISVSQAAFINDPAPPFSLENLKGEEVSLKKFEDKVVFINFWASWCPPCKKEFPELNQLAEEYKDKEFKLLAINLDKKQSRVEKYLKKIGIESPDMEILLDPKSEVVASYVARSMPSSFIVDKKGVIRYVHFGYSEKDPTQWREELNSLLEEEKE